MFAKVTPTDADRSLIDRTATLRQCDARGERGVVLIIALILLVVISLFAVTSMRNAASSEAVAGNVRTTELASQAAEIALRHCEASATKIVAVNGGDTTSTVATYTTTFASSSISVANSVQWKSTTTWDAGTVPYVLPSTMVGGTTTYKRAPECMIELLTGGTGATAVAPTAFVITARGFGPEVAAGTGRPDGTEVWLQSTIEIN